MDEIFEWVKGKAASLDWGDVPGWLGGVGLGLVAIVIGVIGIRSQKRNDLGGDDLPEIQVSDLVRSQRGAADLNAQWDITHVRGVVYRLRNYGPDVTGLTADERPFGGLARDLPQKADVPRGGSVEFRLVQVDQMTTSGELWLTWDGQDEPVAVPIPPVIHR
ncbi:hypothetical protein [Microbispora rosea]|uniref:hypothetical protein n=1 Tax=Microbispora rosea TaxID=58117 RepID=UPI00379EA22D